MSIPTSSRMMEGHHPIDSPRWSMLVPTIRGSVKSLSSEFARKTQLLEIQHRVKNNLQMITALMRIEARNARGRMDTAPFDRLAGRIESIKLLYKSFSDHGEGDEIDLGIYLSEVASAMMRSYAVEGIRLDLKVDAYPVSVNVAMPTGLVVNELLTNALKHAFVRRDGGTITLHSLSDGSGCRIIVADNGVGLPEGVEWPKHGKLSALIVQSLREERQGSPQGRLTAEGPQSHYAAVGDEPNARRLSRSSSCEACA
jgi:two-component sensor histidine kinase